MIADDDLLSAIDVDRIPVEALLFQTGYLTVADEKRDEDAPLYRLDYPNHEVKRSLNALLLEAMAPDVAVATESRELRRLANDFAGLERRFRAFLASIPNEWYANTGLAGYEACGCAGICTGFLWILIKLFEDPPRRACQTSAEGVCLPGLLPPRRHDHCPTIFPSTPPPGLFSNA